ncbi:hypothetical protein OG458_42605 (plasmid) [Streptomyces sp. NBC_01281]|uniref:hypothetical protein n=1 Tax=Streptomyces sp. NBC_01281 TaxID=2903811 RepID=UPI002E123A28|nr:hypothetical protein OG458_42605 [Streptomyces sp. NBC_01281]
MKDKVPAGGSRSTLVRADAISYLSIRNKQLRASELGSDEVVVLADSDDVGFDAPKLPDDFHTDLLFAVAMARRDLRDATDDGDEEDRILLAHIDDGAWVWKMFRPSEPIPEPR